jgi:hypothetical protein
MMHEPGIYRAHALPTYDMVALAEGKDGERVEK